MRVLLVNPPHPSIGSRIPHEHLPPLGLLAIGGPLIDAGHEVHLLDAEFDPMPTREIVEQVVTFSPEAVLIGHSGSTSGHPIVMEVTRTIREALPEVWIIYGGVFPTFHWRDILAEEPQIDVVVRGEGEETILRVIHALETMNVPLHEVPGIAWRDEGKPRATAPAPVIEDLDAFRIGWELIDFRRYSYWGDRRAIVVQFSRGCPHQCNYCGQRPFWRRWRHRDPQKFAAELAWVKFIEAVIQLRPRSLWRVFAHRDVPIRNAMKWYYRIGRQVWPYEIRNFLFRDQHQRNGPALAAFWDPSRGVHSCDAQELTRVHPIVRRAHPTSGMQ